MSIEPDTAGFAEAQARLREKLGDDVTFCIPEAVVWPDSAAIDEETGRPYDPLIQPESGGGFTNVVKRVGVVFRPIRVNVEDPLGGDQSGGLRHGESVALTIGADDYADVEDATEAIVRDMRYKLTAHDRDSSPDDRYIIFAEAK